MKPIIVISKYTEKKKVWGKEIWVANKTDHCGKFLMLKKGYQCSMHYHKLKNETFYVLEGVVVISTPTKDLVLRKGDSIYLPKGTKHQFAAIEEATIIEFSSRHREGDSFRDSKSWKMPDENFNDLCQRARATTRKGSSSTLTGRFTDTAKAGSMGLSTMSRSKAPSKR